jgi:SAM-dependent methyltransferase
MELRETEIGREGQKPSYYKYTSWGLISRVSLTVRRRIFHQFMSLLDPKEDEEVVDIGVTRDQTRPESNFFEGLYPYKQRITALSVEDAREITQTFPGVKFVGIKVGQPLPFEDRHFDLAFCNAVVEHIGGPEKQRFFVQEIVRISRRGLIATPYRYFPFETHTVLPLIHWLPRSCHRRIISALGFHEFKTEDQLHLLDCQELSGYFTKEISLRLSFVSLLGWPSNLLATYWNNPQSCPGLASPEAKS